MTDKETMQGLRACWEHKDCSKCPFVLEINDCHSELAHEAYKTIERLQTENAVLRERLEKATLNRSIYYIASIWNDATMTRRKK